MVNLRGVTVSDGAQPVINGGPFDDGFWAQVSSNYGPRIPLVTVGGTTGDFHYGTDFWQRDIWGANLRCLADGYVDPHNDTPGAGNMVRVRFPEADSPHYFEFFHMRTATPWAAGARVRVGDLLGQVGSTGASQSPHLHLGLLLDGAYVDCIPVFRAQAEAQLAVDVPEPQPGDASPPVSIRTSLELQYVFGKGATVTGGVLVALEEDRRLVVEGQVPILIPAGKLVRRYTLDVPVMPDPHWLGK